MAKFLAAIVGPARLLTCLGDDDGGRLFHPYGPRNRFARATLATCAALFPEERLPLDPEDLGIQAAWWLGVMDAPAQTAAPVNMHFPASGITCVTHGNAHVLFDAGPFGWGGAGHSHADALSLTARRGEREILIDPGTFTYVCDARLRDEFRGTAFHNTVRIGGRDQADPAGPFRWEQKPSVRHRGWCVSESVAYAAAECSYRGFHHRRRIAVTGGMLFVLDEVSGAASDCLIEQFWHLGDANARILFSDPAAVARKEGLRSRVFASKEGAPVLYASFQTALPHSCAAVIGLSTEAPWKQGSLVLQQRELRIPGFISINFSIGFETAGPPTVTRL